MRKFRVWSYEIYTDGAMRPIMQDAGIGFGAWAFVLTYEGNFVYSNHGTEYKTSNQRMELEAIAQALEYIESIKKPDENVIIYSDSAYAINCYLQEWYLAWEKNGWYNSKGIPVANLDLWHRILPFFRRRTYDFCKVKGHAGVQFNEMCDKIAQQEAKRLKEEWRGEENG